MRSGNPCMSEINSESSFILYFFHEIADKKRLLIQISLPIQPKSHDIPCDQFYLILSFV